MRELFIYWRLDTQQLPSAQQALHRWQAALEANWPGLVARLFVRTDETAQHATVMESYAKPDGIAAPLQALIVAQGQATAAPWCKGQRHVEVFEAVPR